MSEHPHIDPERGIAAGQRWAHALEEAATRCEAVLYLISEDWLSSKWCWDEYQLAKELNKKLFALLIDNVSLDKLPAGLAAQWQVINLRGEPANAFDPRTQLRNAPPPSTSQKPVLPASSAVWRGPVLALTPLKSIRMPTVRLAGVRPIAGWEALEAEDAAVVGRSADWYVESTLYVALRRKPPRLLL